MKKSIAFLLSAVLMLSMGGMPAEAAELDTQAAAEEADVAEQQSALKNITFGKYEGQMDYENKVCTAYIPEGSATIDIGLEVNTDRKPISASVTCISKSGEIVTKSVPLDGSVYSFSASSDTSPFVDAKYGSAEMQLKLITLNGTENWTIKFLRKTKMGKVAVTAPSGATVALTKTLSNNTTEAENRTVVTGDYVTLTLRPYAYQNGPETVYVNGEKATTETGTTGEVSYVLNLDQNKRSTIAVIKAVREGDGSVPMEYTLTINRTRTEGVTEIKLDQSEIDLTGSTMKATVQATVTSTAAQGTYNLTWQIEDSKVATIAAVPGDQKKAVITGVADGSTKFSVTDGYITTEGTVLVEKNQKVAALQNIKIKSGTSTTAVEYERVIDQENKTVTVYVPAWTKNDFIIYPEFTVGKGVSDDATLNWTDTAGTARSVLANMSGYMSCNWGNTPYNWNSADNGSFSLKIPTLSEEEVWTINAVRYAFLKDLSIAAGDGSDVALSSTFASAKKEYFVSLSTEAKTLKLTLTRNGKGDTIKVNGTAVELDKETGAGTYEVPLVADMQKVSISVSAEDNRETEYILYVTGLAPAEATMVEVSGRKPESAKLNFTSSQKATGYYVITGADAEELEAAYIVENGTAFDVVEGANSAELKGLGETAAKVQFALVNPSENCSAVYTAAIGVYLPLKGISVDVEKATLNRKNPTVMATVTLDPVLPSEIPEIIWTTDDENVATVQADAEDAKKAVITGVGEGNAVITVTVGAFSKTIEIAADVISVDLSSDNITFDNRTDTTVDMTVKPSEACTVSYVVRAAGAEAPADSDALLNDAKVQTTVIGEKDLETGKTVTLSDLTEDGAKVYLVATDAAGNVTSVLAVDVPAKPYQTGDVNKDGVIDVFDVAAVIDMIQGTAPEDLQAADINGDGTIDVFDAAAIVDLIRE